MPMLPSHTKQLFWETAERQEEAPYTLKEMEHQGKPSLYQYYLSACDLGEFDFANKYLVSYDHWLTLCEAWFFKPYLKKMRRDLRAKLKSEALKNIVLESMDPKNKNYYNANRYLEGLDKEESKNGRGRPKKIEDTSSEDIFSSMRLKEDASRILDPKDTN